MNKPIKDHDLLNKNEVKKVSADAKRPHADGCVGCRRESRCIACGKADKLTMHSSGRCISGACSKCCAEIHKHANGDPMDLVLDQS